MSYTAEEKIKLAGEDSKDRLYEAKQNQKAIRILTVAAYVLCVSLVAIMLSLYYIFFWDPSTNPMQQKTQTIDTLIIPEQLAIRLANRSEVPANRFFHTFYQSLVQDRLVKIRKEVHISESGNLTRLIELYHHQQQQQQQERRRTGEKTLAARKRQQAKSGSDRPLATYETLQQQQQQSRNIDGDGGEQQRTIADEDDASDDYEQSGNYELYSNHTTIQLDVDEPDQQ
uniref:Putative serine/threonine-protein kinase fhkb n=1 Tax=Anopheles braziliensis TaxID=58242 RepID=A0A2M3Z207_9DIPT